MKSVVDSGSPVTRQYFYSGADVITEYGASTGSVNAQYTTPFLDEILVMERGEDLYFHTDELGSVWEISNDDGPATVENAYDYQAFGGQHHG